MLVVAALYLPGVLAIIHPRAAGFTLLLFALLVVLLVVGLRLDPQARARAAAPIWMLAAIPLLFALWANLHGGFIAGLLLIGLVTVGLWIDGRRGRSSVPGAHIAVLAGAGVLAAIAATFATPLGTDIWTYILSFRNPALKLASTEWEPVTQLGGRGGVRRDRGGGRSVDLVASREAETPARPPSWRRDSSCSRRARCGT